MGYSRLQGVKSTQSSFRVRLTYSHSDALTRDDVQEGNGGNKRRKTGMLSCQNAFFPFEILSF